MDKTGHVMAVAVILTSLKCFSPLNRIQVNSTSLGLAMDIENPLASLRRGSVKPKSKSRLRYAIVKLRANSERKARINH